MAHSKSGGTRTYLRGRVGSDVYSIGKDAKGNKQQVVRSLAESVANPQTIAQMRGRMIMSTVMQAVSFMRVIIDHSFDNVKPGQPSVSEFIAQNYALVKADVANHPAASNRFGLNKYGEKGIKQGAYVVSAGSAAPIQGLAIDATAKTLTIALAGDVTIAGLKSKLGLAANDYFTFVFIGANKSFGYLRFHVNSGLASDTEITADNVSEVFTLDGNQVPEIALSGTNLVITLADMTANNGIIVSRKVTDGYHHSPCTLAAPSSPQFTSDVALPTYPVGSARFLNGGSEAGSGEEPVTPSANIRIASATFDGSAWAQGSQKRSNTGLNKSVALSLSNFEDGHTIYFGTSNGEGGFAVTGASQTGTVTETNVATKSYGLYVDGALVQTWGTIDWYED